MRRNVLLLQGPVGPFFKRFACDLETSGFCVYKINFNGGDKLFFGGEKAFNFSAEVDDWAEYLENFLQRHNIGRIYLFGDCRAYHKIASKVAVDKKVRLFVFEEGYIRPNFITLEESGVNGNSVIINKEINLENASATPPSLKKYPNHVFRNMAFFAVAYYLACFSLKYIYPYYKHHRPLNPLSEGAKWFSSVVRKLKYKLTERGYSRYISKRLKGKYFLCPLQVHCDSQVSAHSDYSSVEHFIGDVVRSFAQSANSQHTLVIKHHPMDRGYTDYGLLIKNLAREHELGDRIIYLHDLDLPTLLHGALGTVLINSTVGMSSLWHETPVKTLGVSIYDRAELTHQGDLASFWLNPGAVDKASYKCFRDYLIQHNQVNGSFYQRLENTNSLSGLEWVRETLQDHTYTANRVDSPMPPKLHVVAGRDLEPAPTQEPMQTPGKVATR
jgi:capsular polysaccharide export protein